MDRSPFRNDLDAALEKNRRLEVEIAELKTRLRPPTTPVKKKDGGRRALPAAIAFAVFVVAMLSALLAGRRRPPSPTTSAEPSGGIAIAPKPTVDPAAEVAPARPRVRAAHDSTSPKPCTCAAGDPLCSCL